MQANLNPAIDLVLNAEGGYCDRDRREDPGGPTNMGVTLRTLSAWRRRACTVDDLKVLTLGEASGIFQAQYAAPVGFDALPAGLDYAVLDCAVNSGPARAVRLLQGVVGTTADGIMGAHTLAAVAARPARALIGAYGAARLDFMQSLANWSANADGWTARVERVRAQALAMAMAGGDPLPFSRQPLPVSATAKAAGPVRLTATRSGKAAIASVVATTATAGTAASQASGFLTGFADLPGVHYALAGLAVLAAVGTFAVAAQRTGTGATT